MDCVDQVVQILYKVEHGAMTATQARTRRMDGGFVPLSRSIDAKSVYAAVTATFIKRPADRSLLCHIQYLRELLDRRILPCLTWLDTRDMSADGLTCAIPLMVGCLSDTHVRTGVADDQCRLVLTT